MASVVISGDTSGSVTLSAPAVAGTTTLTLPSTSGTVLTTGSTTGISGSAISTGTVAEAYGGTGTNTGYYGFKNRIINGGMVIAQRGTGTTTVTANGYYSCDRWNTLQNASSKYSVGQSSTAPAGFTKSLLLTSLSAYTVGASEQFVVRQGIEGVNTADLGWGAAGAQTVTVSFWVRSSLTGSFGAALYNNGGDRSYPFSYTINSANTWEQKSVTIAGDTTGTWVTDSSGAGIYVSFSLGSGTTYSGTANTWAGTYYVQPTGSVSLVGTNGATLYITGVQLEKGSTATSFDYRPYGTELALCQRYCQYAGSGASGSFDNSTTVIQIMEKCVVTMRAAPSGAIYSGVTAAFRSVGLDFTAASPALANFLANTSNVGGTSFWTQVSGFTGGTSNAVVTARNNQTANGGNFILLTSEL